MLNFFSTFRNKARGSALLITLFTLAFIGLSVGLLHRRIFRTAQVARDEILGRREEEELWHTLGSELTQSTYSGKHCAQAPSADFDGCALLSKFDLKNNYQSLLAPQAGFPKSKQPLWDARILEESPTHCLGVINMPPSLTPSAIVSIRTCQTLPAPKNNSITIDGNLFLSGTSLLLPAPQLVVSGALVATSVTTPSNATIFAGGDIQIDTLTTNGPLSIISATGAVTIKSYSGPAALSVITPLEASIPGGAMALVLGPVALPTKQILVLGVFEKD